MVDKRKIEKLSNDIKQHAEVSLDLIEYLSVDTCKEFMKRMKTVLKLFKLNDHPRYKTLFARDGYSVLSSVQDPTYKIMALDKVRMIDIDTKKSEEALNSIADYLTQIGAAFKIFETLNGYHVFYEHLFTPEMDFNDSKQIDRFLEISFVLGGDVLYTLFTLLNKTFNVRLSKKSSKDGKYHLLGSYGEMTDTAVGLIELHCVLSAANTEISAQRSYDVIANYQLKTLVAKYPETTGDVTFKLPEAKKGKKKRKVK